VSDIVVEGPEAAERRFTATRLVALGPLALAFKKDRKGSKEAIITVTTRAGDEAMFRVERTLPREIAPKLEPLAIQARRASNDGNQTELGTEAIPKADANLTYKLRDYDGGLEAHPTPESVGELRLVGSWWELHFKGAEQIVNGELSDYRLEADPIDGRSCLVSITDLEDEDISASFVLSDTSAERFTRDIDSASDQHAPASALSAVADIPEQIRKLSELKNEGILTDEEFAAKKAEFLARM
jgi:hypothetical protein